MRVVAAMSGGVDSSVVAGLLVEQGHEVIGVHMKLHDAPSHPSTAGGKHCCGLDDALDARRVADRLGIPFYVMDLRQAFQQAVMDDFVATYAAGATPNPCIQCNGVLKFKVLLQRARALGASHLATGHYARIGPGPTLQRAADLDKDQSYFLFPVTPAALAQTLFPLGGMTKDEVRGHARRLGLVNADKPESQEVCFIPDDDHARFVQEQRPDLDGSGDIVHQDGRLLGQHDGYWRYTVGQRRGLGVATGEPLYVLSIDAPSRRVVVGPDDALLHQAVRATGMSWSRDPADLAQLDGLSARIRHRGGLVPARVQASDDGRSAWVHFRAPARAAAKGQAVVLYQGDDVLGGGWIREVQA